MKQGIFLRAMQANAEEATIDIVGIIGWETGFQQLKEVIKGLGASVKRVVFDIYSPGGDVWDGNGIVQLIGELGKKVETVAKVQVAASMATLIAVASQKRSIAQNGRWLVHNAWTMTVGDAKEHEKAAQALRACEEEAAKFYALRTGKTADEMKKLMAEERWVMPEEAKEIGFVQEICDPFKPEEYDAVKQEIVAAGKWPKALVEMPEVKKDEGKDVPKASGDTEQHKTGVADAQQTANDASYNKGLEDGKALGRKEALCEIEDAANKLKEKLAIVEKEARANQSAKDQLAAQLAAEKKDSEARIVKLQEANKELSDKLKTHLKGSLKFEPDKPITFEQAMSELGGYAAAADKYPQLLQEYRARKGVQEGKK